MTWLQTVAAVAGVGIAVYPYLGNALIWARGLLTPGAVVRASGPSFRDAIASLAGVRTRLSETDRLGDAQKKAIDVLTLALVDGSDV